MSQDVQKMPLLLCEAIERAAIMEYDGGMTRDEAEAYLAKSRGFETWKEMIDGLLGGVIRLQKDMSPSCKLPSECLY